VLRAIICLQHSVW